MNVPLLNNVQLIEKDGQPEWAVIPYQAYQEMLEYLEDAVDLYDYYQAKQALADGEPLIPGGVTFAVIDGLHPVQAWRDYRQLSLVALAEQTGLSVSTLQALETRQLSAEPEQLQRLAEALQVTVDMLAED